MAKNCARFPRILSLVLLWHIASPLLKGQSSPVRVAGPSLQLTQYSHFAWRVQDGYFSGSPNAITQTPDGYMWIGTDDGLKRFDGASFTPWATQSDSKALYAVQNLVPEPDGGLWVGSLNGLAELRDGHVNWFYKGRVNGVARANDGTLWVAKSGGRTRDGYCKMAAGTSKLECSGEVGNFPCDIGQSVSLDASGGVWIGCNTFVAHWHNGALEAESPVPLTRELADETNHAPMDTLDLGNGRMLIAFYEKGLHFGLQQRVSGQWTSFNPTGLKGQDVSVTRLLKDRDGGIWVGTTGSGLYHVVDGKADHYSTADGLSGDDIASLYQDREGSVWVATQAGIDRFHRPKMVNLGPKQGMISNFAQDVVVGPDGSVAVSMTGGINFIHHGQVDTLRSGPQLPGYIVAHVLCDHRGLLWASTDKGLGRFLNGKWRPVSGPELDRTPIIEDRQQEIIVQGDWNIFRVAGDKVDKLFALDHSGGGSRLVPDPYDGFWVLRANGSVIRFQSGAMHVLAQNRTGFHLANGMIDSRGRLWGWGPSGIYAFQNGDWRVLSEKAGLACDGVHHLIDTGSGALMVYGRCGVSILQVSDLDAWLKDPSKKVSPQLMIDGADGASGGDGDFPPGSVRSPEGRIWFTWGGPLQYVDMSQPLTNLVIPPVHIQQIVADRKPLEHSNSVTLPAHTRDLEIDYAALSFVAPRKVRFRYRLSGFDKDWQDVGGRKQAFYMNLPPGQYTFQVVASNNDDIWNQTGDTLNIYVQPAYYQTLWFRLFALTILLIGLWLLYLYRLRTVSAKLESRLFERYSERERIARELHDTLLQGFQAVVWSFQGGIDEMHVASSQKGALQRALDKAETALAAARSRVRDLRSNNDPQNFLGIDVIAVAEELDQDRGASIEVIVKGDVRLLSPLVHEEVLAIIKEALTNAVLHSRATRISCELCYDKREFCVTCVDNGIGIPLNILKSGRKEGHYGLLGMRERAHQINSNLELLQAEPQGTSVRLIVKARMAYRMGSRDSTNPAVTKPIDQTGNGDLPSKGGGFVQEGQLD